MNVNASIARRCLAMLLTLCMLSVLCFSLVVPAAAEVTEASGDGRSSELAIVVADGEKVLMKDGVKVTAWGWYTTFDGKWVYVTYSVNNTNGKLIAEDHIISGSMSGRRIGD